MSRRQSLDAFTDRAIRATDAGKFIPPIVYLPSRLRGNHSRLTVDMVRVTTDPPTIKENHLRILEADPLGFLIAMMHGQPIPAFEITVEGSIKVRYEIADFACRERVAKWLAHKVTIRDHDTDERRAKDPNDWDALVEQRGERERIAVNEGRSPTHPERPYPKHPNARNAKPRQLDIETFIAEGDSVKARTSA